MGQLEEYFQGKRTVFDVELDPVGTDFQKRAWKALLRIPYGEVSTYSQQAHFMGSAKWARAVGGANGRNPVPIFIPCHRVIGKDGSLTGFAGGLKIKSFLLQLELENQDQFYGNEKKYFL
jgi:methylated-DNA-[protein]-cysteine S-methyltransferase